MTPSALDRAGGGGGGGRGGPPPRSWMNVGFWRVLLFGARKPKQDEEKGILLEEVHSE